VKLAFISESPADEAALAAFCEHVLNRKIECVPSPARLFRGWPALKKSLSPALRSLKWTEVDLIVVCADGDGTDPTHPENRQQQLHDIVFQTGMRDRTVVALAYPQIEAWWLAPLDPNLHEKGWSDRNTTRLSYEKNGLKKRLYGTDKPNLRNL
jgi:hypothetical protein